MAQWITYVIRDGMGEPMRIEEIIKDLVESRQKAEISSLTVKADVHKHYWQGQKDAYGFAVRMLQKLQHKASQ